MRRSLIPFVLLSTLTLSACGSDFELSKLSEVNEGADTAEDTGSADLDSAADSGEQDSGEADSGAAVDSGAAADSAADSGEADSGATEETSDPAPEDDCDHTSDLIYVLSRDDSALYLFDPDALTFSSLGRLSCGTSASPGSMAVSRDGQVFVRLSDNTLYAVDLATMACTRTAYSDRSTGFDSFGMGYATDDADTWRDQLYVANEERVGRLDTETWEITPIASMPSQSELTGNAAGELWAFLPLESPAQLIEVDKDDGARLNTLRLPRFPSATDIDTFAFAGWGGSFYLFVRVYGMGESTDVYRVQSDGTMEVVLEDVGFDAVGAGVSTCAPS